MLLITNEVITNAIIINTNPVTEYRIAFFAWATLLGSYAEVVKVYPAMMIAMTASTAATKYTIFKPINNTSLALSLGISMPTVAAKRLNNLIYTNLSAIKLTIAIDAIAMTSPITASSIVRRANAALSGLPLLVRNKNPPYKIKAVAT